MNNIIITLKKELKSIFRDKKYLTIIFLLPLIIPAFIIFMGFMYDGMNGSDYVVGTNYYLNTNEQEILNNMNSDINFIQKKEIKELENLYNNKEIAAYIIKDNNTYYLYTDTSTESGMIISSLISSYLENYNNYLANNYLVSEGINPNDVFNIITLETKDLAKEGTDYFTNFLVNFALTYLVMIIAITAMNTTTDIIAGEKERGTFETLLTFPIKSTEIITGKFLAIVTSCIISSIIGITFSIPAFMIVKNYTEMFKEMQFNIDLLNIILGIIVLVVASCLSAGICIALTGNAKTFKEAQSKQSIISFLSIIPMFAGLIQVSSNILYLIPITNCGMVLNEIFLGSINYSNLLLVIISTIIYTFIILLYISRQYKSEKTLF